MLRALTWSFAASLLAARTWAAIVQPDWVYPEFPDYTTTMTNGDDVTLSWDTNLQSWFASFCGPCDTSNVDLWLVGGSGDMYQFLVAAAVDVTSTLSVDYTIDIPADDLEAQQVWSLRFVPSNTTPHGSSDGAEISSPQFQVVAPLQPTTSIIVVTSTPTPTGGVTGSDAAASTTATPTATPVGDKSGLSTGAQAGIGVGVGLVALIALAALAFFLLRRRRDNMQTQPDTPEIQQQPQYRDQQQPPGGVVGGAAPYSEIPGQDFYAQEQKPPGVGSPYNTPVVPAAAPPYMQTISHGGYKAYQPPVVQHSELPAHVDPAELDGSGGNHARI